jgi:hypothetical protein
MNPTSAIPASLHYCPQCWQELASGLTKDGVPRICKLCILENVRVKVAFPYLNQSDEPEEQPEEEIVRSKPPIADKAVIYALIFGFGLMVGMFVGKFLLQVSGAGNS